MGRFRLYYALLLLTVVALTSFNVVYAQEGEVTNITYEILKNPKVYIAIAIQFLLGLALGYVSFKILKYILALIAILALGSILSVWSISGTLETALSSVTTEFSKIWPYVMGALQVLGVLTVGPVAVGFILGIILALIRK
ncbi:MAG: hypothetical protein B7O98_03800 [Zestosphaera tikiterensis]|uniref:Uncharacterized protein n=1 Tax=Zestosphaera tikiterensis TaxID=1973259 RepID=A0A2R7Y7N8_9CREN|nr:MAG: hypothetical protein B7O98_03800 [Zestosphaera tikiterensis]